jgi:carbamoyltransferase
MLILGLNAFHVDSAAALVRDGKLVAAAEEERFRRVKHWAGFPSQSIAYCLREAGVGLRDIDRIAVNQNGNAQLLRKAFYVLGRGPELLPLLLSRFNTRKRRKGILELLGNSFPGEPIRASLDHIEHHLCHMFSAFYVSPFDTAAVLSVDGFGDFSSAAWGRGEAGSLTVQGRVLFPHSLGLFYQALTQYLGFPNYGDEYKVMGLAPYGTPSYLPQLRQMVRLCDGGFKLDLNYFRHQVEELPTQWDDGSPIFGNLFTPALEAMLGPARASEPLEQRHRDIAASVQAMYEEAFFHMLEPLQEFGTALALAGGCAANSVANGKVRRKTKFDRVYVQSAAGDAGGAIGAAFAAWQKLGGQRCFQMDHAFWGPHFSTTEIACLLADRANEFQDENCAVELIADEGTLCARTAALIAEGKVVGWFQGRMEWGPRALGNRSILADPRRADMKAILNAKIKRRESFRPFAPSILDRAVSEWFEEDDAVPFMMQVFQIRAEKRAQIPAVTHVDGSGRLQTVTPTANPRYYRLIDSFLDITGIPMVLNTSFNENEPVVCTPDEALNCFLRTRMDALILGDYLIERRDLGGG